VAPSGVSGLAFDAAADGLRFLIKMPADNSPITVVGNWTALMQNCH
jgi:hypothetical protein